MLIFFLRLQRCELGMESEWVACQPNKPAHAVPLIVAGPYMSPKSESGTFPSIAVHRGVSRVWSSVRSIHPSVELRQVGGVVAPERGDREGNRDGADEGRDAA